MEERIRFITHKGQQILLINLTNCSAAEVAQLAPLVPSHMTTEPRGSVLLLADFSGVAIDKPALEILKQATVFARPYLKRSAWVGVENLPHVFYENIKSFSRRDLPTFRTREEALEFLVGETPEKMASGQ